LLFCDAKTVGECMLGQPSGYTRFDQRHG
jgi:hypothetical protein